MAPSGFDPADHLTAEFGEAFPSWHDLRRYVNDRARIPEFDTDRALHQLVMSDFAARLVTTDPDWILFGSLALPTRVPRDVQLSRQFRPATSSPIDPIYAMPRTVFDLDLATLTVGDVDLVDPAARSAEYARRIEAAVRTVTEPSGPGGRGVGLGGLVRYTVAELCHLPEGKVMGAVTAQPVDPRYGARVQVAVDAPLTIELDLNPPGKVLTQPPEQPQRPTVAFDVPGIIPFTPPLYPTVNQLADKICLLTGPPRTARDAPVGPWHRYKDLFDVYYLISTCRFDAEQLRAAIAVNPNMARIGRTELPRPYRFHAETSHRPETVIPWQREYERMRDAAPQLRRYPTYQQLHQAVVDFVDPLATAASDAVWEPNRGWEMGAPATHQHQASAIVAHAFPQATSREQMASGRAATGSRQPSRDVQRDNKRGEPSR